MKTLGLKKTANFSALYRLWHFDKFREKPGGKTRKTWNMISIFWDWPINTARLLPPINKSLKEESRLVYIGFSDQLISRPLESHPPKWSPSKCARQSEQNSHKRTRTKHRRFMYHSNLNSKSRGLGKWAFIFLTSICLIPCNLTSVIKQPKWVALIFLFGPHFPGRNSIVKNSFQTNYKKLFSKYSGNTRIYEKNYR